MALPSSGTITLAQIQTEFGGSSPTSLSEYYRGGAYVTSNNTNVPTSGTISLSNFYGAARLFSFTISSNQTNANLRSLAVAAGWDQSAPVAATIGSGVYISSNSTGTPALTVDGSFPAGVTLINSGFIVGMGGNGGAGANWNGNGAGAAGSAGGLALSVSVAVSINNAGTIAGGGGGGGGGQGGRYVSNPNAFQFGGGGGGGGRSSNAANSTGGAAGVSGAGASISSVAGGAGTVSAAGTGGAGATEPCGVTSGGSGGNGGAWGTSGSSGANGDQLTTPVYGPFAGGSGGGAITGNSNITYIATGTRLGAIS